MENFAYADTAGNIGFATAGHVPVRSGGDGSLPAPGWTGQGAWTGWIPFDELPRAYNPPSGIIVNAIPTYGGESDGGAGTYASLKFGVSGG